MENCLGKWGWGRTEVYAETTRTPLQPSREKKGRDGGSVEIVRGGGMRGIYICKKYICKKYNIYVKYLYM